MNSNVKEEIMLNLHKVFKKMEEEGTFLNSFNEATINLIQRHDDEVTRLQRLQNNSPIFLMIIDPKSSLKY